MKTFSAKTILFSAVCLAISSPLLAHEQGGVLKNPQSSTDYYQISCDSGTAYLEFAITDEAPVAAPIISAQVSKGYNILSTSDNVEDGSAGQSPELIASWGAGSYYVMVNKSKAGVDNYSFTAHCMSADNVHMDETIQTLQDQ
jgi:hypothetical protein